MDPHFSGEDFVTIGGGQGKILLVFPQLFNMNVNALAYPYLGEQLESFGYEQGFASLLTIPTRHMTLVKENAVSD